MKLSRFISLSGFGSRRKAEIMIREGRVEVNGEVVCEVATRVYQNSDEILLDGSRAVLPRSNTYLILHKPPGFICSTLSTVKYRSIYKLLPEGSASKLKYAGRLDADSEGLVLLTDDGELINRLTHPRYQHGKIYLVKTLGTPRREDLKLLERGVQLDDGQTAPCNISLVKRLKGGAWLRVEIFEGRKRQLRRMFETIGHHVVRLKRVSIGTLHMGSLRKGAVRELTPGEIEKLKQSAGLE